MSSTEPIIRAVTYLLGHYFRDHPELRDSQVPDDLDPEALAAYLQARCHCGRCGERFIAEVGAQDLAGAFRAVFASEAWGRYLERLEAEEEDA